MRNLFRFIFDHGAVFGFIGLQLIAFWLIINYTYYQQSRIYQEFQGVSFFFEDKRSAVLSYFNLREENEKLMSEINTYKNLSDDSFVSLGNSYRIVLDTLYRRKFYYRTANCIHNSIHMVNNQITLNKGRAHGIEPDMAVISPQGLVGKTISVSEHFSLVLPIIHPKATFSIQVLDSYYFGLLKWDGGKPTHAKFTEIANHADVQPGDTVITRESLTLPKGIPVGEIVSVQPIEGSNFLDVDIRLFVDFASLYHVQVVQNALKEEQIKLEQQVP